MSDDKPHCPKCYEDIDAGLLMCPECGAVLAEEVPVGMS